MNERATRCALLAAVLATSIAACHAASVDLGSDLHPPPPQPPGDHGVDAGATTQGSGGTSTTDTGSGGAPPGGPTTASDAGPIAQRDAGGTRAEDAGSDAATDAGGCAAHHGDCDGDPSNGCETDLDTTTDHCGTCDRACPPFGFMSFGSSCVAGQCALICEAPHDDCDGNPDNGCEADLRFGTSADSNCGACGVACDCDNGVCR
jgi:hypothetical protein